MMVDLDWKTNLITSAMGGKNIITSKYNGSAAAIIPISGEPSPSDAASYEHYLRLPELSNLWATQTWPEWKNESVLKPSLQALEITFRLLSVVLSDSRPYTNKTEWRRKLEGLANREVELIAALSEEDTTAPVVDLCEVSHGVLQRDGSSPEVWKLRGSPASIMVSRVSEKSLLPRLQTWKKAEESATKIGLSIECHMHRSPFTLGLGEPNLDCKPILQYDLICRPSDLHALKKNPFAHRIDNAENQTLCTVHQILEALIFAGRQLLQRIEERIESRDWEDAARDCYILERVLKVLAEVEELHLLMDPDDFLRLKNQLSIGRSPDSAGCFGLRSQSLYSLTKGCRELKHWVPTILGVEVDPRGGPRIQEAAMRLFHHRGGGRGAGRLHLLQAFQAVEAAVKRFYFGYHQVLTVVMGSLEAKGNHTCTAACPDALSQNFMEPPYFPSLDAAKTFLGDFWR